VRAAAHLAVLALLLLETHRVDLRLYRWLCSLIRYGLKPMWWFISSLSFPTLGSTVKENYGAPKWEEDRPKRPLGVPILLKRENGHKCPQTGNYSQSGDTWEVELEEVVLNGEACRCGTGACP